MFLKQMLIRGACHAGAAVRAVLGPLRVQGAGLLMYHRVAEPTRGVPAPTINVPPHRLRQQLLGLRQLGYDFRPLGELLDMAAAGEPAPERTLAVTFDDGYENMHTRVLPVVCELQIPVTVFLCTAWLDSEGPMEFDAWGRRYRDRVPEESYRPLRLSQCRALQASGLVDLGAHTHTHRDFRGRVDEYWRDLRRCVEFLDRELQVESPAFAFPFGRVDEGYATFEMVEGARAAGVRCALTTEPGPVDFGQSPFYWGRNNVFAWDTAATIDARLCGWYQWLPAGRRRLRQLLGLARHPLPAAATLPDAAARPAAARPDAEAP